MSQVGPHAAIRKRGTWHPRSSSSLVHFILQLLSWCPCHHPACPLPAHSTSIPLQQLKSINQPLSFLFLALSPSVWDLLPGPSWEPSLPSPECFSDQRGQHQAHM